MAAALSALLKRTTIDDHEEVLKACNASLKQSKGDLQAQHVRVIALIKLDRYDDALRVLDEQGDGLKQKAQLEHAYALYKVGELEEAKRVASHLDSSRGAKHVEAQASYRLEAFPHAAYLYKELSSNQASFENEENDLRINAGATDAQLEWKGQGHYVQKKKPGREDMEAFETAYNAACGCIARGEFGQGEVLLKRAKDLCNSSEYLTDQEKTAEILPISVQQLFVLSSLGKVEQAEKVAEGITINEIPDPSTRQIAQINKLTATSKPPNPYLNHRLFHSLSTLPKTERLFQFQEDLTRRNEMTLDLLAAKYKGVAHSTAKFLSNNPSPTTSATINSISVINAAAHSQNQTAKLALKEILPFLEKRPKDVALVLTIVQLYLLTNNHGSAITVMESFLKHLDESTIATDQDVRFAPGLVAVLVSLYGLQGRKSHIKTELAKAASYWRHKSKPSSALLRAAGLSLLDANKMEDLKVAGEIFETLHQHDPNDRFAIAGYVAAHATTDLSKVETEVEKLSPINRLTAGIDTVALEAAGVPQIKSAADPITSRKRAGGDIAKPVKKRFRKSRLPKEYDPNKPADPERWLPLRDRSTYRPKGRKGKQKVAALTQGGVSEKGSEGLNMAGSDGVAKQANTVIGPTSKSKKKRTKK